MSVNPPLQILIVDDEPERSKDWANKIRLLNFPDVAISAVGVDEAKSMIDAANNRRKLAREEGLSPFSGDAICGLDSVDILVVDYDLQEILQPGRWSTGLEVAALARAFTQVKTIVLVNQFGTNNFDLTLTKNLYSYADFDVGSDQLLNPAFWSGNQSSRYAPWAWNGGVLNSPRRVNALVNWVKERLDQPVLTALGFCAGPEDMLDPSYITKDLWPTYIGNPENSFRKIVEEAEFLTAKDRDAIVQIDESCARVAAALISHWLDRLVVPSNEVLMDLPHLAAAYPWLLTQRNDAEGWQKSASLTEGFDAFLPKVRAHQFEPAFMFPRPVVWRNKVLNDGELAEPNGFTYDDFPDLVFCEDTSKFQEFTESRVFSCRLPTRDVQRFVSGARKFRDDEATNPFEGVLYEPSVFFTI